MFSFLKKIFSRKSAIYLSGDIKYVEIHVHGFQGGGGGGGKTFERYAENQKPEPEKVKGVDCIGSGGQGDTIRNDQVKITEYK